MVCRDAVSGHEIRMMLALSLLDELICLEGRGAWLYYLSKQGKRQFFKKILEIVITCFSQTRIPETYHRIFGGRGCTISQLSQFTT